MSLFYFRASFMGAICLFSLALSPSAQAFDCDPDEKVSRPNWMSTFGQNTDAQMIYGFAQTKPQRRQSLSDITQLLKNNAMADLALNIQSNVSSNISTELSLDGDEKNERTTIQSAAQSSLSIGALSDTRNFVDTSRCMVFTRVSLQRKDVPYVLAISKLRQFETALTSETISLEELAQLPDLLQDLALASETAATATQQQFEAAQSDLRRLSDTVRDREIALKSAQLETRVNTPRQKRDLLESLLALLDAKGPALSSEDEALKQKAQSLLSSLENIVGSNLTAVSWSPLSPSLQATLGGFFSERTQKYWMPDKNPETTQNAQNLAEAAQRYELKSALFIDVTTLQKRQFGIAEVDITLELNYFTPRDGISVKRDKLTGRAIGRNLNDKIISDKIIAILEIGRASCRERV